MGRGKQSETSNEQAPPSMLFFVAPFLTENHLSAVTATNLLPLAIELNNLKIREFYDEACKATIEAQGKVLDVALGKSKGNKSVDDEKKKFCAYMRELATKKAREFEALMREEVKKKEAETAAKCSPTPGPWLPPWGSPWYLPPPAAPMGAYMPMYSGTVSPPPNWAFSWPPPPPPSTALPESNKNGATAGKKQGKPTVGHKRGKSKGEGHSKTNDDSDSDKPTCRKGKRGGADASDSSSSDSSDDSDDPRTPAQKSKCKGANQSDAKKKQPGGAKKGDNSQSGGKSVHFAGDDKTRSLSSNVNPYVPGAYSVQQGYIRYDCAPGFGAGGQQLAHRYRVYGPSGGLWPDEAHGGGADAQVKKGSKSSKGGGKSDMEPAWMAWGK